MSERSWWYDLRCFQSIFQAATLQLQIRKFDSVSQRWYADRFPRRFRNPTVTPHRTPDIQLPFSEACDSCFIARDWRNGWHDNYQWNRRWYVYAHHDFKTANEADDGVTDIKATATFTTTDIGDLWWCLKWGKGLSLSGCYLTLYNNTVYPLSAAILALTGKFFDGLANWSLSSVMYQQSIRHRWHSHRHTCGNRMEIGQRFCQHFLHTYTCISFYHDNIGNKRTLTPRNL